MQGYPIKAVQIIETLNSLREDHQKNNVWSKCTFCQFFFSLQRWTHSLQISSTYRFIQFED